MLISFHTLSGQKDLLSFSNVSLDAVVKTLELETDLIFNYDPKLLKDYYFTGDVEPSSPSEYLDQILYYSPFNYEKNGNTILIYEPKPISYRVCGKIIDDENSNPLTYANIVVKNTTKGFLSDDEGFFDFTILAAKNQYITISYIGYESRSIMVQDLIKNNCPDYILSLNNKLWNKEIIVTDYILDGITEGQKYGGYNMDYDQLSKHHSNTEHDILKTAQLMPGITSLDESASNLQIRGSTPDQNLILWEGATVYHSGHLFGMISAINPFSIDQVNIYKGAYDPQYDNRVGGIIDVSLTDSLSTTSHGSVGTTLTEAHLNLELPIVSNKLSLLLSGRHSINEIYSSPPLQNYRNRVFQFSKIDDQSQDSEDGFLDTDQQLQFHDWNAKVLFKPTKNLLFKAGVYRNLHRFEYSLAFPEDPFTSSDKIVVNTDAMHASIDYDITEKWMSTLSFLNSSYGNKYDYEEEELGELLTDYYQFNDISDRTYSFINAYKYSSNLKFNAGYDYNIKRVNFVLDSRLIDEPGFSDTDNQLGQFHNIFSSVDYHNSKLSAGGGIRTTYYQEQKKWFFSPRFNLQYALSDVLKAKIEGGFFHQFISQLREYGGNVLQVNNPLWIINSDKNEPSQNAQKIAAGVIFHKKGWLIDMETYYNNTRGLSTLSTISEQLSAGNFEKGRSNAIGLDVLIKKRWKPFNTWLNYSMGRINYLFPEIIKSTFIAPNDIRHNVSLVCSYQYRDFHFSISGMAHSGLPYSLPSGTTSIYDEEFDAIEYGISYDNINNDRLRDYLRVDCGINYRPTFKKVGNLKAEFSLSIINLLNRENVFAREYYLDNDVEADIPPLAFINKVLLGRTPLLLVRFYW